MIDPTPAKPKSRAKRAAPNGAVTEEDLLQLIDGKTMGEFTSAAINLALPSDLKTRLLNANDLVPGWIDDGKVTTDGDTYTRIG